jgi:hypothetical protein
LWTFRWATPLVALVLLVAALLKAHQLATEPVFGISLLESRWLLVGVVQYELFLAFWLLSGLFSRTAWWFAIGTFGLFAVVSGAKALAGEPTCGCFGQVPTSPWLSLAINFVAILALAGRRLTARWTDVDACRMPLSRQDAQPNGDPGMAGAGGLRWLCATWILAGACFAAIAISKPATDELPGIGRRVGDFVIIQPDRMVGHSFTLARYIDIGEQLNRGRWLVVLYRADCSDCARVLSRHNQEHFHIAFSGNVALVSVPPHATNKPPVRSPSTLYGALSETTEWIIQTPSFVEVQNGRVETFSSAFPSAFGYMSDTMPRNNGPPVGASGRNEKGWDNRVAASDAEATQLHEHCAAKCLYVLAALIGRPQRLAWCIETLKEYRNGSGAVSMLGLRNTCQLLGLEVSPRRGSFRYLRHHLSSRRRQAILHVLPSHFILAVGSRLNDSICIVDPALGVHVVNEKTFSSVYTWSGDMLLIAESL